MGNNSVGGGVAALGVVLIVFGVILYLYPQETSVLGYTVWTEYPYRSLGTILLVLGIIVTVVGAVVSVVPSGPSSSESHRLNQSFETLMDPLEGQTYHRTARHSSQSSAKKYCRHCGQAVPSDSAFCEHCGKEL